MKQYLNKEFLLSNKNLILKVTAIVLLVVVAFFVFVLRDGGEKDDVYIREPSTEATAAEKGGESETTENGSVFVDISGAVKEPMVAELPAGSRIIDAIKAAGGLKNGADIERINRAAFVNDGDKIIIPMEGETGAEPSMTAQTSSAGTAGDKVNINTATSEELQTINGVGPVTAEKIITYREKNGPFKKTEDLKKIDGIGDKTYDKLKEEITI